MLTNLKVWAKAIRRDVAALAYAQRHPHTPWYAKAVALFTVAYALSPIDLIPDFIPVLGYLDDLILLPLGILLAIRLIPKEVMCEAREKAAAPTGEGYQALGLRLVVLLWVLSALIVLGFWYHRR